MREIGPLKPDAFIDFSIAVCIAQQGDELLFRFAATAAAIAKAKPRMMSLAGHGSLLQVSFGLASHTANGSLGSADCATNRQIRNDRSSMAGNCQVYPCGN